MRPDTFIFAPGSLSESDVLSWLQAADNWFEPSLSGELNLLEYARKLATHALFYEARMSNSRVGLIACYCNDIMNRTGFITHVAIAPDLRGSGLAGELLKYAIGHVTEKGFKTIRLEVGLHNIRAQRFYLRNGFDVMQGQGRKDTLLMEYRCPV